MCPDGTERKLAAILSADVAGYSRLMAEDEAGTVRTMISYRKEIQGLVGDHRGRVVDAIGDELLAEFPTALDAVECAVEVQRVLSARNAGLPEERRMRFRIGVHMGDVTVEGDRLYGDGVNIAARLQGLAEPGRICISGTVQGQVRSKLRLGYVDMGDQRVKNIPDRVRVFEIDPARSLAAGRSGALRTRLWMGAAALLIAAVWGAVSWRLLPPFAPQRSETLGFTVPGFGDVPAIAVLPFDNLSADPDQEYFADGVAEELITRLANTGGIPVIARNSSFLYKGQATDVKSVGRELGVGYVVEGSVRRAQERVRITAQLIDTTTGAHVWAERYDRKLEDILQIQDEITEAIAASVGATLVRSEADRAAALNGRELSSREHRLRGLWHLWKETREDNLRARDQLQKAIDADPEDALAYALLAVAHNQALVGQWTDAPARSEAVLRDAAHRCIELDRREPTCFAVMAGVHFRRGRQGESLEAIRRAVELAPGTARYNGDLGILLALSGLWEEALPHLDRAMRLDPGTPSLHSFLAAKGWAYFAAARYDDALAWLNRSRQAKPDFNLAHRGLAATYARLGRMEEARAALAEELRLEPDVSIRGIRRELAGADADFLHRYFDGLRKAGMREE